MVQLFGLDDPIGILLLVLVFACGGMIPICRSKRAKRIFLLLAGLLGILVICRGYLF